jgi:hypothetical protein
MPSNDTRDFALSRRVPASSTSVQSSDSEESSSNEEKLRELERLGVNPPDVLCGRDKFSHIHPGNSRYRIVIEGHRAAYQSAPSRDHKTQITIRIVKMVRGYGGRFLKLEGSNWVDVGDMYAREKVSHALRSAKDPMRLRNKKIRKVVKHIPTKAEDALFQETLRDQQQIFQELMEKEAAGLLDVYNTDASSLNPGL